MSWHCHEEISLTRKQRNGSMLVECVVAAGLVVAMLAVAAPTVVRVGRIWKQTTHHQLACNELDAQMDQLIAMSPERRAVAVKNLVVDEAVADVLDDAQLVATISSGPDGQRIELSIDWSRLGDPPPIKLTGWVDPLPSPTPPPTSPPEDTP